MNFWFTKFVFFKVFIDQNGDAEGNFTIVSLLKDKEGQVNMSMQPVGYFQFTSNGSVVSGLPVRLCIKLIWFYTHFYCNRNSGI